MSASSGASTSGGGATNASPGGPSGAAPRWLQTLWPTQATWQGTAEARARIHRQLDRSRSTRAAADALRSEGHCLHAAELAARALRELTLAVSQNEGGAVRQPTAAELNQWLRGISDRDRRFIDAGLELCQRECAADDARRVYDTLTVAHHKLARVVSQSLRTKRGLQRARALRVALLAVVIALVGGLAVVSANRPMVLASSELSAEFPPAAAVDGNAATEWLLPDRTLGWLELRLAEPRRVERVAVCNAHNRFYLDRASRNYRVELYEGAKLVMSAAGHFARIDSDNPCREHPFGQLGDRAVVHVDGFHGLGAGLSEVRVE